MGSKRKKKFRLWGTIGLVIYILLIGYYVLFSERYDRNIGYQDYHYNLELFHSIKLFWYGRQYLSFEDWVVNLFGNCLAFTPFGFYLPMIRKKFNVFQAVFATFLFSFSIETIQLVTKVGVFDVDDLFLNTVGGLLGYLVFEIYWIYTERKRLSYRNQEKRRNGK
ncbi:MAG: VanZ family protein [Lachnospiraceae bacterium]